MIAGFLYIVIGVFFVWAGSLQLICSMAPHDVGMKFAEAHGAWIRENVFNLPPTGEKDQKHER